MEIEKFINIKEGLKTLRKSFGILRKFDNDNNSLLFAISFKYL